MSELKKPIYPYGPSSYYYEEKVEKRYIYSYSQSLREHDDFDDDDDEEEKEVPKKPIQDVDLGWLLTQIPEGISPSQIKIEFDYSASSMSYDDHYVKFYYNETIPARPEEFKAAKKEHDKKLEQYKIDLKIYEDAAHEKAIREAEDKLARLRAGK
jgi:hypothetical protein